MSGAKVEMAGSAHHVDDDIFKQDLVAMIPSLRSFARGLCGTRELADDMAQDTLMRAWVARDSYTPGTHFRAWLYRILRNNYYSNYRKNSRLVAWDPEIAERLLVEEPAQEWGRHLEDVMDGLAKLPAEQREALMMVTASGMSYEETAEVIGCAIGTVKSRVSRGRAALLLQIEGTGNFGGQAGS
jgi:RNA polymerase sigma-70 factor, ECF subfamily